VDMHFCSSPAMTTIRTSKAAIIPWSKQPPLKRMFPRVKFPRWHSRRPTHPTWALVIGGEADWSSAIRRNNGGPMKSRRCIAAVTAVMVLIDSGCNSLAQDSTQTHNVSPDTPSGSVYAHKWRVRLARKLHQSSGSGAGRNEFSDLSARTACENASHHPTRLSSRTESKCLSWLMRGSPCWRERAAIHRSLEGVGWPAFLSSARIRA
jgi:hypothetical protein